MAIAVLALGIGSSTAVFSVANKVLLEPLPYPEPDRLLQLITASKLGDQSVVSIPKYVIWREHTTSFESMAAYDIGGTIVNLATANFADALRAARVSADYFTLFGARVSLGRTFSNAEDRPAGPRVTLISERLWRRRFGAEATIVGRVIALESESYEVIGVLAAETAPHAAVDVWLPLQADPASADHISRVRVVARLKPDMTVRQAQRDMDKTMRPFLEQYQPQTASEAPLLPLEGFWAIPLRDAVVGDVRPALYLLIGAVAFVLLISCANGASLLLARATRRTHEFAMRVALGAQRQQIIWQLLAESLLLAFAAGVLGLALGYAGVHGLLAFSPGDIPRIGANASPITLDWRVLLFTCFISALTGIMFGLLPALTASRTDVSSLTKDSPTQSGMGSRRSRTRPVLVITEMALALVLLVGAGLLIRAFVDKRTISRGFDEHDVLTLEMSLSSAQFEKTVEVARLIRSAERRIQRIPGVAAIATTCAVPLEPSLTMPFTIFKFDQFLGRYDGVATWRSVSPGYFGVFRIRLLRGRLFTEDDDEHAAGVALINRAMLKRYWHAVEANPIDEFLTLGKGLGPGLEERPRQIIGVVADVRDVGLDLEPGIYVPAAQVPDGMNTRNHRLLPITWVVRTEGQQPAAIADIQRELRSVSGGRPLGRVRTMHEVIAASAARTQFYVTILTAFAGIALLLAAVGLYSLMAYSVQQRTHEIGIRMALGAAPEDVRNMVVIEGLRLALLGIIIGIPAALALTRITISLIFGVHTWDPAVLAAVTALLALVALAATYVPSVSATRVDPASALRG